jgi:hypothetical protein
VKLDPEELDSPPPSVRQLGTVLGKAAGIAREMIEGGYLPRLFRMFMQLPRPDRLPVLDILEREVASREASVAAGDGLIGTPNGLGTIYIRIFETDVEPPAVSRDDMVRSTIEATALMTDFPPALGVETERVLFAALDVLTDEEARLLSLIHDDVIATLGAMRP